VEVWEFDRGRQYCTQTEFAPQLELETPTMFTAISFGSISLNACKNLAKAACSFGTYWNTGEGELHREFYPYVHWATVQVASGRFRVNSEYLGRYRSGVNSSPG